MTLELERILNITSHFLLYMWRLYPREINMWMHRGHFVSHHVEQFGCGLRGKKFPIIKIKVDFAKRIPDDSVS